jgi:hypothetical protein
VANKEFSPKNRIRLAVGIGLIPVLPVFLWRTGENIWYFLDFENLLNGIIYYIIPGTLLVAFVYGLFAAIAWAIATIAERKGRSWPTFFVLSLVLPVISWIIVAVISTDTSTLRSGTKKCPKCAEVVKEEAVLCKHCGSDLKAK